MASWNELLEEVDRAGSIADTIRKRSLSDLNRLTGRNAIVYYSGWLQKLHLRNVSNIRLDINDADKEGFMATIHGLDRSKGLFSCILPEVKLPPQSLS